MAENVMKVSRNNTFRFEGTVNVTDKTFVINKTNERNRERTFFIEKPPKKFYV